MKDDLIKKYRTQQLNKGVCFNQSPKLALELVSILRSNLILLTSPVYKLFSHLAISLVINLIPMRRNDWQDLAVSLLYENAPVLLVNQHMRRARLAGLNLSYLDLSGVNFEKADLKQVSFEHSNLTGAIFSGAALNELKLTGATRKGGLMY